MKTHNPTTIWPVPEQFRSIYSHAAEVPATARTLYISGQVGVARDGTLATGFAAQCEQAMDNIEAVLAASGMTAAYIVKLTYFLTQPSDLPALGAIRRRRWSSPTPPAVTVLIVAALAHLDYLIEIEAVVAG